MNISDIYWGDDSAEKDPNLLEYFVPLSALSRLTNKTKTFIVGRKGAGKSAVRKKLLKELQKPTTIAVEITPTHNSIRNILQDTDVAKNFNSELFFQYVWLRHIYRILLLSLGKTAAANKLTDAHLEFARNLALSTGQATPDVLESLVEVLQKIKIKAGKLGDLGVTVERVLRSESEVESYEHHLIEASKAGIGFVAIIDDLDLGWDNSPVANNLLLGLLQAANHAKSLMIHSHFFICIRDDMYHLLMSKTTHSDKYRDIERVRWSADNLKALLTARIRFNRTKHGLPVIPDNFLTVFPERIGTHLTQNWLFERTLGRPRELLQLARLYSESNATQIPNAEMLKEAEKTYSNWKLEDLATEFLHKYPGLGVIFNYWKTKFLRQKYHLSNKEIQEMILTIFLEVQVDEEWYKSLQKSANTSGFLTILYEIGFLGDYILGGQGGTKIMYSINELHTPIFNEVQIHPCFRHAVQTVQRIRAKATDSSDADDADEVHEVCNPA